MLHSNDKRTTLTIRAYSPEIELTPGLWVNVDFQMLHGFAGFPGRVKTVKAASVVLERFRTRINGDFEEDGEELKRKTSILWVCDTREEAFHMQAKSREYREAAHARETDLKLALVALKAELVEAALKTSPPPPVPSNRP